jgi:hypothetical protein
LCDTLCEALCEALCYTPSAYRPHFNAVSKMYQDSLAAERREQCVGWRPTDCWGHEYDGWGRREHSSDEHVFDMTAAELRQRREQQLRINFPKTNVSDENVYVLTSLMKQYVLETAIKRGLCAPKHFDKEGKFVDIEPEVEVKTSTEREERFLRFMITQVLSVRRENLLPEYIHVEMKEAYINIKKVVDPSVGEDSKP